MISLTELILRLRDECPMFEKRVGGTAAFSQFVSATAGDLPLPYLFVIPMYSQDVTASLANFDSKIQTLREYFATVVCVDNRVDRGHAGEGRQSMNALDELVLAEDAIKKAFTGWRPLQKFDPVRFSRGAHLAMDNTRLWHQFEWFFQYEYNPDANPATEAAIDEIVNGMSNDIPYEESTLAKITRIYINYGEPASGAKVDTLRDFWPRAVGNPDAEDAGNPARTAAANGAEYVETVQPREDFTVADYEGGQVQPGAIPDEAPGHRGVSVNEGPHAEPDPKPNEKR